MSKKRVAGLDMHAETIAVAVAEPGGEVRSVGIILNRLESVRKLVGKLEPSEAFESLLRGRSDGLRATGS